MGRTRIPTKLKVLKGTAQPCRMNPNEPGVEFEPVPDHPPEDLTPDEVEVWHELRPLVDGMQVGTRIDVPAFRLLVEAVTLTRTTKGDKTSEWVSAAKFAQTQMAKWGMSPADRSRVSVLPTREKAADPVAEFVR
jgi:hypothetical protein